MKDKFDWLKISGSIISKLVFCLSSVLYDEVNSLRQLNCKSSYMLLLVYNKCNKTT